MDQFAGGALVRVFSGEPFDQAFGPTRNGLFDLLVFTGKQFMCRDVKDDGIGEQGAKTGQASELLVDRDKSGALPAQEKSDFVLGEAEALAVGAKVIGEFERWHGMWNLPLHTFSLVRRPPSPRRANLSETTSLQVSKS
jgi:hypothetical protein